MGHMSQAVNEWIEKIEVDYYEEFMNSLEKQHPKLHEKFMDAIVNYASVEVTDNWNAETEDMADTIHLGKVSCPKGV